MPRQNANIEKNLFALLRIALDSDNCVRGKWTCLSPVEWNALFELAKQQSIMGIAYRGVERLPQGSRPPMDLLFRWAAQAESIRGRNCQMNQEAARMTALFKEQGRRTAVLKGQANARLYPDAFLRQPGDIDLWVEGGQKNIDALLAKMKLFEPGPDDYNVSRHHVHLPKNRDGILVEVHYKPASGNPYKDGELQSFLTEEVAKAELVPEGFYAPSIKFALVMQLSHIQQHFYSQGLGLRQYMDYFVLLQNASEGERQEAAAEIKNLSMGRACSAVMWLLGEVFGLPREKMLCSPSSWRGQKLLRIAMEKGNFGKYREKPGNVFVRWFQDRLRSMAWIPFDPANAICHELKYWRATIRLIPLRIKRRRVAL